MSAFATAWLDLREPADRRARSADLMAAVARHFRDRTQIAVTDLGCGTGATLRVLAPHLPAQQHWRLVDRDPDLLAAIEQRCDGRLPATRTIAWQAHAADVQTDLDVVMALPADLVTLSAFLDLTSSAWLERLATAADVHRRPIYATLTYDGRIAWEPADPFDSQVWRAFNAHQERDKGFGGALGPLAAARLIECLAAHHFTVHHATADWMLGGHEAGLQAELVKGWHQAAAEQDVLDRHELDRWQERRLEAVQAGRARITVGHVDIWALPTR